jgi:hypothetical protein
MVTTGMIASIQVLHNSYFRIARKQQRFLLATLLGLVCASILLAVATRGRALIVFAWVMAISILFWWLVSQVLLRDLVQQGTGGILRNLAMVGACSAVFLFSSSQPLLLGSALYLAWLVLFAGFALRTLHGVLRLPRLSFFSGSTSDGVGT